MKRNQVIMRGKKKGELRRVIGRILIMWVISAVALVAMSIVLNGVYVDRVGTAIVAMAVISLVNALLWPALSYLILPFAVLTLGIAALVLNGVLILLASAIVPGFEVANLGTAILLSLGVTAITGILASLLTIRDDSAWYRNVLKRHMRRREDAVETDEPGFLFLELDGLGKPVLERAMSEGYTPTLARWLESGSHRLVGWETDMSSQTSASQAGILHGSNHNIPAFRWYDREAQVIVASSNPKFVGGVEKALSDGNGLLSEGGASRGNLFSGDAPSVMNTASTILDRTRFHTTDFYAFLIQPYNLARTLLLFIWDIILEKRQFRRDRRNNVYPILDKKKRGGAYPLMRAFMTVIMRELNVNTLVGDMFAGVPAAYATFVGYDEVAHHSGVESEDALDILKELDRQLARLETAAEEAARPYHFVALSDHGQTGGATFKQRYGTSLEELVQKLVRDNFRVQGDVDVHEDWSQVNVLLTETVQYDRGAVGKPLGQVLKGRTEEGQVELGPQAEAEPKEAAGRDEAADSAGVDLESRIIVLASGNLGLVYGTQTTGRATLEQIEDFAPGMVDGLAQHEGVGFVLAHSEVDGPVAIGGKGRCYLDDDRVEGENPLADFGPRAAQHLRRNDSFPDAPDLYVNSFYDPETCEGAAFEEQIGFHGGMGGPQTEPFLLFPVELELGDDELVGAASVYRVLKGWQSQGP